MHDRSDYFISIEDDPQDTSVNQWPNLIDYFTKQINILLLTYTKNILVFNTYSNM